ncbi:MAG: DNA-formamidopyrimidine glycosylase family protein [Planctomycetota bacterium]
MPELPEVECWGRRVAERVCVGRTIDSAFVANDNIVFAGVKPRAFARAVKGRHVLAAHRKGKQLWLELDRGPHPLLHFGMTGHLAAYTDPDDRPRFTKVEFTLDNGTKLAMPNPRRFGRIRLLDDPLSQPPLSKLGFDPYLEMLPPGPFIEQVQRRKTPIKALLLNQSFAAGVGNWIADEVLYQAKVAPRRQASGLSDAEARHIRTKLTAILNKAIEVDANKKRFPRTWLFHDRWGKTQGATTRKGEAIVFDEVAGRTTAWVPTRQV